MKEPLNGQPNLQPLPRAGGRGPVPDYEPTNAQAPPGVQGVQRDLAQRALPECGEDPNGSRRCFVSLSARKIISKRTASPATYQLRRGRKLFPTT
jgi:hypothetical protein